MKTRNNLVEFARFLFSMLVIGYHVQASFSTSKTDFFEWGALAVEFFFILTGFFFAKSIEKYALQSGNLLKNYGNFMIGKIKGILPTHTIAIIAVLIIIACCDAQSFSQRFIQGLPSIFLVQMVVTWNSSFDAALIVPEWYISSMLLCLAIMFPIAFLLRKKVKGVFVPTILVTIVLLILITVGFSTNWTLPQNLIFNVRAWSEMCIGMFAYYLSVLISKKELNNLKTIVLKIVEIVFYIIPILIGFIPLNPDLSFVGMIITVICTFVAISITFAGKGVTVTNQKVNSVFGFLGGISLATYLFHPAIIQLLDYVYVTVPEYAKFLITFSATLLLAVIYKLIAQLIVKCIIHKKQYVSQECISQKKLDSTVKVENADIKND